MLTDFSPLIFKDKNKEKVQRTVYNEWVARGCKGTLEIATGVGKTMIGLMAIQQQAGGKVYVVVPSVTLMQQWVNEIRANFPDWKDCVGKVGGGHKEYEKSIVVAVVNSIRDYRIGADMIIMDEMHRYGSEENYKFLKNGSFKKILGLTATAIRQDGAHKELFLHAPLVYKFSQKEAIQSEILSGFELTNMMVGFTAEERFEYLKVNDFINKNFKTFNNDFQRVQREVGSGGVLGYIAADLMRAFTRRRTILLNAENKVPKTVEIIKNEGEPKTLVFTEYIKTADKIVRELKKNGVHAGKYHSKMKSEAKEEMLSKFRDGELKVMVAVKALDEGTNIPDCEMAIIVAGTSVPRQMIQRLGRILRVSEGKKTAKVYQLYIPHTKDYDWMKTRNGELMRNANSVRWL